MDDPGPLLNSEPLLRELQTGELPMVIFLGLGMLFCLLLTALCASSENAFFSHRESDLEKLRATKGTAASNILHLLSYPKHLLATVLVLNSLGMIAFVVQAEVFFETLLNLHHLPLVKFFIDAILVTIVILIFGEVMPKVYATQHYQASAKVLNYPMRAFLFILWPFTNLLVRVTTFLEKRIRQKPQELTPEELSHAIDITTDKDDARQEKEILKGIVNIAQTQVRQIMRPRMDVAALDQNMNFSSVLEKVAEMRFSRMPVYADHFDHIVGVLNIKSLLPYLDQDKDFDWRKLLMPAFFVPESKMIDDLLHEFRKNRMHLAIVVDEFGGSQGIVTLEDCLEEVFGEIIDEFDEETRQYSRLDDNTWLFEAKTPIVDFLRIVHLPITFFDEVNEENDTLGGLITEIAGKLPRRGEKINYRNLLFTIDSADLRRINLVKVEMLPETETSESS
ncbi:MAG: gliding motility-associated protein GldE [Bacteroidetes bacterium]|nr:gliding motility-associated protein GldE [Bacteroidota bacterium]